MKVKMNRWIYAIAGVVVLLLAGLVYAWSVLAGPIAAYTGFDTGAMSLTFTITMSFFCVGGFVGGLLNKKVNVRINLIVSGVIFLIGFFIASRTTPASIAPLYIGFGVLAGFASGLAYNAVMSTISRWFPDKQGLISGILLMGFGLSSFIIGKIYAAVTPADGSDLWKSTFVIFGVILLVILVIGCIFFVKPEPGYKPAGMKEPVEKKVSKIKKEDGIDVPATVMLRRPAFWLYFIWAIALSAAGLALLSQARGIVLNIDSNTPDGTVATVVGLISIFNGIGRILFGGMYDKLGRKWTMLIADFAFVIFIAVLLLALLTKSFPIVVVAYILGGLAYSAITPTNSAFINAFYGSTHYPVNFSMINLNLIVASFSSTIAGNLYQSTQSYMSTCVMIIVLIVIGFITTFTIRKP